MSEETKQDYLTLFEAARLCSYSEAYLRLRARQGKLKSIKIGKKWMTTKDWINDYVMKSQEWNDKVAAKRVVKEASIAKPGNFDFLAPNIVAQPAKSYTLPQIEFTSTNLPAISTPQPPRSINYANPQFLFVLGSSALLALLLFVWMTAGLKGGLVPDMQRGQANLASVARPASPAPEPNNFEVQMDPQILEKALSQNQEDRIAAVDQAKIILPVVSNN
jgi:hypothetical protein